MGLGGVDLNLLLPLKVLLEEGNVTRAGRRLDLSQPAMSTALARLRRRLDDELLVRTGRDYELTPFARDLLPEVQEAVRLMSLALDVEDAFDPLVSEQEFRVAMSDYGAAVLHEPLVDLLGRQAPGVRVVIERLGPQVCSAEHFLHGVDAVVAPLGLGFPAMSRPLWRDRLVVLVDRGNPRLDPRLGPDGGLGVADLEALPHAVASFGPGIPTADERVLGEAGIDRKVAVRVFGFLPLPFIVEGTDLVAVVPERLARLHVRPGGPLVTAELPCGPAPLVEGYWFTRERRRNAAQCWFLDQLDALGAGLRAAGSEGVQHGQPAIGGRAPVIQPTT